MPSLQIARALVARGHAATSIELYGSRRGQEAQLWPTLEFPFTLLPGRGIRRSLRPAALWANAGAVVGLVWACLRAVGSFAVRRPRVVVGVGGYAGFPAGLAAVVTRTPLVIMSPDAAPGAVNVLLGRFAAANAVAFEDTGLPRAHVTGTPVKTELATLDRSNAGRARARVAMGLPPDRPTVAAFGGSLGALRINRAVADLASTWSGGARRTLYQVTGRRDYAQFADGGDGGGGDGDDAADLIYRVVPFEDRMPTLMGAADLCVSRAGAMTVAELLLAGMPSILVPLPGAPAGPPDLQRQGAGRRRRRGAHHRRRVHGRALGCRADRPVGRRRPAGRHGGRRPWPQPPRCGSGRGRTGGCPCPLTLRPRPCSTSAGRCASTLWGSAAPA